MANDVSQLWDLLDDMDFGMMVTEDSGTMRGRPMSSHVDRDNRQIHFLTERTSAKVEELHHDRDLLVTYSDHPKTYISISGRGSVTSDPALIEKLWGAGAEAWLSEERKNGQVAVVTLHPQQAEYWNNDKGVIANAYEFGKGVFTDEKPDMGENAKVNL